MVWVRVNYNSQSKVLVSRLYVDRLATSIGSVFGNLESEYYMYGVVIK